MAVGTIYNSAGYGSAFQTTGVRPADQFVRTPAQPVDPARNAQKADEEEQQRQSLNAQPTDAERQEALDQGRTRGSFVDIRA